MPTSSQHFGVRCIPSRCLEVHYVYHPCGPLRGSAKGQCWLAVPPRPGGHVRGTAVALGQELSRARRPCEGCCTSGSPVLAGHCAPVSPEGVLDPQVRYSQCLEEVLYLLRQQWCHVQHRTGWGCPVQGGLGLTTVARAEVQPGLHQGQFLGLTQWDRFWHVTWGGGGLKSSMAVVCG